MKKVIWFTYLLLFFIHVDPLLAESIEELKDEIERLRVEVRQLIESQEEHITVTHQLGKDISGFKEHLLHRIGDILLTGGITTVLQGTTDIGDEKIFDYSYTMDINLEADVSEHGKVVIAWEAGNGSGVNDDLEPISIVNYDPFITETATEQNAFATISVSQAYYEGNYYDGGLVVSVGKLDVHSFTDDNAFANDETDQFMTGLFVRNQGTIFAELDSYYAPGIAIVVTPAYWLDMMIIGANGYGSGFEDIFDNGYGSAQIALKRSIMGKEGNYRFYGIFDYRDYRDINDPATIRKNIGYGISIDQELFGGIGIFTRFGTQDDRIDGLIKRDKDNKIVDINSIIVESTYSLGTQIKGGIWERPDDVFGIAYGSVNVNKNAADIRAISNPDDERHLEVYYKISVSDHFTLSPDFQLVSNIGGDANKDSVKIFGIRTQLNF